MPFILSVEWVDECQAEDHVRTQTQGVGVSAPPPFLLKHLCKILLAELPSASDSISGTCLATLSSPRAKVTSGEQLLISVCMHTVCENMQDSKLLVYYLEVILPTGTVLLEQAAPAVTACHPHYHSPEHLG